MGIILLNVIPQLEAGLQMELEHPEKSKLPSFFIFDIQDDQVLDFKQAVVKNEAQIGQISPMVRGRLILVNGKKFEKVNANKEMFSREEEREARFRNRGFNLSYRSVPTASEEIIEGTAFSGIYDSEKNEVAELSVEVRFADRLGLNLGDILKFEIQSVPILAKIVNLRSVRWTSFSPNFFLQFQPGVLEEAPKTFVASITNIEPNQKNAVQNNLVKLFPNISIVDVARIVKRISSVSHQMSMALQFMAILCVIVGLLVMYSIASHQAHDRKRDINLIKVLGARFNFIRALFVLEFSLLAGMAGAMGIFLSMAISYGISSFLFDGIGTWNPLVPLLSFSGLLLLVASLAYFSVRKVLGMKASFYL